MLSLIEVHNYRCLKYIKQPLSSFHVMVGPNASGKSTFLDVVAFLGDLVSEGLEFAISQRSRNFKDLLWKGEGKSFEMAVEAAIPNHRRKLLAVDEYDTVRYEIEIGIDEITGEFSILNERGWLQTNKKTTDQQRELFPNPQDPPSTIITERGGKRRKLFGKIHGGNDNYYADARPKDGRWAPAFKLGPRKSTLGNLPEDEENFPVSTWFKHFLSNGIEKIVLNSSIIRRASPPGQSRGFRPDGSNLPWVVENLLHKNPLRFKQWLSHLESALPDLESVSTIEREDDKHRYLMLHYKNGIRVPSWMASDGTLRLMALTLTAYLEDITDRIYLIEEPENGIHPRAIETMYQSLSSVYGAQLLLATHSPVLLSVADIENVLCFAKTADGRTDIVNGKEHPALQEWHGAENLGVLYAGGVLS